MSVDVGTKLNEQGFAELLARREEPEWLIERRRLGLRHFLSSPLPKWDRTDMSALEWEAVEAYRERPARAAAELPGWLGQLTARAGEVAGLVLQQDSTTVYSRLDPRLAEQGVIVCDLGEAVRKHGELVRSYLFGDAVRVDEDRFTAAHAAFWSGGVFVYVPRYVEVELPLQAAVWSGEPGLGLFRHLLLVLEEGAVASFVDLAATEDGEQQRLYTNVVEMYLKDGAQLKFGALQNLGSGTFNYTLRRAVLGRDAQLQWLLGDFGSRVTRATNHTLLRGTGAGAKSINVFFGSGRQHLDLGIRMQHIGTYTAGDMLTRGVLKDEARAVYRGLTDIEPTGANTSAYQRENTLMLSEGARIDAIPGLEIENNNVSAGHAATSGQIDEVLLFYLQSRGLSRQQATKLIVDAFFEPIMNQIPLESVRTELQALIDRKMVA